MGISLTSLQIIPTCFTVFKHSFNNGSGDRLRNIVCFIPNRCSPDFKRDNSIWVMNFYILTLKKETGDRRQETGGKLHGDSLPQVMREHPR
ncbi:hypothetical protein [Okeania sp. SIO1F9]|uniref:hypothetical protein n=1 Tax=Okeania sp. SIO1F9 TaxID=2607813 RepID=UPI00257C7DBF|nr:hypothetical protein [Okeania sp. SIO1F9]